MISVGVYFPKEEFYLLLFCSKIVKKKNNKLWHYAHPSTETHPPGNASPPKLHTCFL